MDSESDEEMQMEEFIGIQLESIFNEEANNSDDDIDFQNGYIMSPDNTTTYLRRQQNRNIQNILIEEEQEYTNTEKESGKYYIGSTVLICNQYFVMNASISTATFLKYNYKIVTNYLNEMNSFYYAPNDNIEIMKLIIKPNTNERTVILKTFWLRIIQRRWKRIMRERKEIYKKRLSIQNINHREIRGKHLYGLNVLPSLYGMIYT